MMDTTEIRLGLRRLLKDRMFGVATVATLAVCMAANTVLFSVVNSVLLRPLPVPQADRLVLVYNSYPNAGAPRASSGVPDYYDRTAGVAAFESLALYTVRDRATGESGRPERVAIMNVTPSFFRVARVKAEIGRTFTDQEGELGQSDKALLSHAFWQERFGGEGGIVGRSIRIDGRPHVIVGVMPAAFEFLEPGIKLWTPLAFTPEQRSDQARHSNSWTCIGRLRDGATVAQAQAQIDAINATQMERFPELAPVLKNAGFHTVAVPLQADLVQPIRSTLYLLWGGTLLVLLIGCVNVINLALVRGHSRQRELAMFVALGAGRGRLVRQIMSESLILTLTSGLLGLLLGWGGLRVLGTMNLEQVPRAAEIAMDGVAVAFTLGLSVLLGLVIGAFPLSAALRANIAAALHEGGRTGSGGRATRLVRRTLVVSQVGLAFVLLLGAGLLVASFQRILAIDPGFDPHGVLTASVALPASRYPGDAERGQFATEALRRVRTLPGISHAAVSSFVPFDGNNSDSVIFAEGYQMQPGESVISPTQIRVSPDFFQVLRIPLRAGRIFDDRDARGARPVVIVDERLARKFWPGRDPVGQRMYLPNDPRSLGPNEKTEWLTVVGVVGSVTQDGLVSARTPVGAYYFPMAQSPSRLLTFSVRTAGDPTGVAGALRREVAALDPDLPVFSVKTMEQWAAATLVTRRWPMLLAAGFGSVALLLSGIGIYGVLAYLVAQRTREIGIRMALGSTPRSIAGLVVGEGAWLLAGGLALGAVGAAVVRRTIEAHLYGVRPTDPVVIGLVVVVLASVAVAACLIPARRATRVDPVIALNRE